MKNNENIWQEHWNIFAEAFIHPITSNGLLSKFVSNPDITGSFAESYIRHIAKSMLPHYRISSGAVIRPADRSKNLKTIPQCDIIIWDPSELPALFEQEEFALVHHHSVRAIIEVKRSCSNINKFNKQLIELQKCLPPKYQKNILGLVVSHPKSLFPEYVQADWLENEKWATIPAKTRLLIGRTGKADTHGIFVFIYFLSQIAGHKNIVI